MKIAFFVSEDINIGAGYIIAHLKKQGHDVRLMFDPLQFNRGYGRHRFLSKLFSIEKSLIRKTVKSNPDMICISCVTATYQWGLRMAKSIKLILPAAKIVFGGIHATLVPEEVKRHTFIDDVVVGDGIEYFGGKFDPDSLWPDREIFLKELPPIHRKYQLFMTSFGCPFNCTFCANEQLRKVGKHNLFRRTVKGCIDELTHLKERGMKYVLFVDDIFISDKAWLNDFLGSYRDTINLPFACFIHPKFATEEVVKDLAKSKCHVAWMGIQTGFQQLRETILNRYETNEEIMSTAKLIKDAGIKLMIDHIFGIPRENMLSQDLSYGFYHQLNPDVVNCYQLLYFPKSKIIEYAVKFGYLSPLQVAAINRGKGVVYQTNNEGEYYYDTYVKGMVTLPLRNISWELLPLSIIKLIVHLRAGRAFIPLVMIQNDFYFTWQAILKKMRLK